MDVKCRERLRNNIWPAAWSPEGRQATRELYGRIKERARGIKRGIDCQVNPLIYTDRLESQSCEALYQTSGFHQSVCVCVGSTLYSNMDISDRRYMASEDYKTSAAVNRTPLFLMLRHKGVRGIITQEILSGVHSGWNVYVNVFFLYWNLSDVF